MSRPLNVIVPAVGAMNLVSMLKQVVLPAPFGPIKAWIAPRLTRSDTSLTALKIAEALGEALGDENVVLGHSRQPPAHARSPRDLPAIMPFDGAL